VSLPKGREPASVDLDFALKLLSLPRTLGTDPKTGEAVTAGLGRYGPYVERAKTYRNLPNVDRIFNVTLEEALELLAQKKSGPVVLKELGAHPESGEPLRVLEGRYGPYVTDGSVNASLPKGDDPEAITMDGALDLLARAAARGKGRRRGSGGRGGGRGRKS
jgi:DNA topoisomerase-1